MKAVEYVDRDGLASHVNKIMNLALFWKNVYKVIEKWGVGSVCQWCTRGLQKRNSAKIIGSLSVQNYIVT